MTSLLVDSPFGAGVGGTAFQLQTTTLSAIGAAMGTSEGNNAVNRKSSSTCHYFGRLFKVQKGQVFEFVAGVWVLRVVVGAPGLPETDHGCGMIFPILVAGAPRLVILSMTNALNIFNITPALYNPLTNTFTVLASRAMPTAFFTTNPAATNITGQIRARIFNNLVVMWPINSVLGTARLMLYDALTDTLSAFDSQGYAVLGSTDTYGSPAEWQESLWWVGRDGIGTYGLYRMSGGGRVLEASWAVTGVFETIATASPNYRNAFVCAIFVDPTDNLLYAIMPDNFGGGPTNPNASLRCYRFSGGPGAIVRTDVTAAVLPAAMQVQLARATQQLMAYVDNETVPGSPTVRIFHQSTALTGGVIDIYDWINGGAGVMTAVGSIPVSGFFLGDDAQADGARIWTPNKVQSAIASKTPMPGVERLSLRNFDPAGPSAGWSFQLRVRAPGQPYATTLAVLSNPSAGVLVPPNTITGLSADTVAAGGFTFTVDWSPAAAGLAIGQRTKRVPRLFT